MIEYIIGIIGSAMFIVSLILLIQIKLGRKWCSKCKNELSPLGWCFKCGDYK